MKDIFKKITVFAVLTLVFLTAALSVSACSGSSNGNKMIVVSEERFNDSVKPKDGEKLKFSPKKLRKYDEDALIVGKNITRFFSLTVKKLKKAI